MEPSKELLRDYLHGILLPDAMEKIDILVENEDKWMELLSEVESEMMEELEKRESPKVPEPEPNQGN
ncbi:MAG: hypothetical protein AAFY71_21790 [Bacteroidota bacterium]